MLAVADCSYTDDGKLLGSPAVRFGRIVSVASDVDPTPIPCIDPETAVTSGLDPSQLDIFEVAYRAQRRVNGKDLIPHDFPEEVRRYLA